MPPSRSSKEPPSKRQKIRVKQVCLRCIEAGNLNKSSMCDKAPSTVKRHLSNHHSNENLNESQAGKFIVDFNSNRALKLTSNLNVAVKANRRNTKKSVLPIIKSFPPQEDPQTILETVSPQEGPQNILETVSAQEGPQNIVETVSPQEGPQNIHQNCSLRPKRYNRFFWNR